MPFHLCRMNPSIMKIYPHQTPTNVLDINTFWRLLSHALDDPQMCLQIIVYLLIWKNYWTLLG